LPGSKSVATWKIYTLKNNLSNNQRNKSLQSRIKSKKKENDQSGANSEDGVSVSSRSRRIGEEETEMDTLLNMSNMQNDNTNNFCE
jgi:hypothetical protein